MVQATVIHWIHCIGNYFLYLFSIRVISQSERCASSTRLNTNHQNNLIIQSSSQNVRQVQVLISHCLFTYIYRRQDEPETYSFISTCLTTQFSTPMSVKFQLVFPQLAMSVKFQLHFPSISPIPAALHFYQSNFSCTSPISVQFQLAVPPLYQSKSHF